MVTADAPNEAKLLALPGKGAFEQIAEWRERDRKLVGDWWQQGVGQVLGACAACKVPHGTLLAACRWAL